MVCSENATVVPTSMRLQRSSPPPTSTTTTSTSTTTTSTSTTTTTTTSTTTTSTSTTTTTSNAEKDFYEKKTREKMLQPKIFLFLFWKMRNIQKFFRACNFVFLSFCKIFAKGNKNNMSDAQTSFENPGSTMGSPPLTNFREKSAIWTCFEHRKRPGLVATCKKSRPCTIFWRKY